MAIFKIKSFIISFSSNMQFSCCVCGMTAGSMWCKIQFICVCLFLPHDIPKPMNLNPRLLIGKYMSSYTAFSGSQFTPCSHSSLFCPPSAQKNCVFRTVNFTAIHTPFICCFLNLVNKSSSEPCPVSNYKINNPTSEICKLTKQVEVQDGLTLFTVYIMFATPVGSQL